MKHIAGWFRRNNTIMAQAKDLSRQLQEAWDARGDLEMHLDDCQLNYFAKCADYDSVVNQLHRVARERDNERKLRLEAEGNLQDYIDELSSLKAAYYSANNKRWDLETANAELLEALEIALASVEWMAGATDADPADHERLATVQAVICKAKESER